MYFCRLGYFNFNIKITAEFYIIIEFVCKITLLEFEMPNLVGFQLEKQNVTFLFFVFVRKYTYVVAIKCVSPLEKKRFEYLQKL